MDLKKELTNMAKSALIGSRFLSSVSSAEKNSVLRDMALALIDKESSILKANRQDIFLAKRRGLSSAFIDRMFLDNKRIKEMSDSLLELTKLADPAGEVIKAAQAQRALDSQGARADRRNCHYL